MKNRLLCVAVLLLSSAALQAAPTVIGSTISWPDDGWYEVQNSNDYTTVCSDGTSCDVEAGVYKVINHSTGEKFRGIEVEGSNSEPPGSEAGSLLTRNKFANLNSE